MSRCPGRNARPPRLGAGSTSSGHRQAEVATSPLTPADLARANRSLVRINGLLRDLYPERAPGIGGRWVLTEEMVAAVMARLHGAAPRPRPSSAGSSDDDALREIRPPTMSSGSFADSSDLGTESGTAPPRLPEKPES